VETKEEFGDKAGTIRRVDVVVEPGEFFGGRFGIETCRSSFGATMTWKAANKQSRRLQFWGAPRAWLVIGFRATAAWAGHHRDGRFSLHKYQIQSFNAPSQGLSVSLFLCVQRSMFSPLRKLAPTLNFRSGYRHRGTMFHRVLHPRSSYFLGIKHFPYQ
jgi:hypothetical protein